MNPGVEFNPESYGYTPELETARCETGIDGSQPGRVLAEHKERYIVLTKEGECEAEVTGNLRFGARGREDFPVVGDWVNLTVFDAGQAVIHSILPRSSFIKRKAVGSPGGIQAIAANVDRAFLVQAMDRDFNLNRLERYLSICHSSRVDPLILLTKKDLVDEPTCSAILEKVQRRMPGIPVLASSSLTREGIAGILDNMEAGRTYCMLGSSGVGKSTLLNLLSGHDRMKTGDISASTQKGRHVTSHRELVLLDNGSLLVDNPGMREVGTADDADGLEHTFDLILELAQLCRYGNCSHTTEAGCAVLDALREGTLDEDQYENYMKLEREKAHFETSQLDRKQKEKQFGKIMKNFKKDLRKNDWM
ncbi:MAG: ribosome small subunit-dependent GTPase A [Bacteroidales bacterium]